MTQEHRTVRFDETLRMEAYQFKGVLQKFPTHFHEYYVIGFIESGLRQLTCMGKTCTVAPGDLLLFNPQDNHACEAVNCQPLDYRCINIKPEVMQKAVQDITGSTSLPRFTQNVVFHSDQVPLLHDLHRMIFEQQPDFQKEELFLLLIEQLLAEYAQPQPLAAASEASGQISAVCSWLDAHYSEHVSLDALGKIANMNKYTLLRTFTRVKGITPYRYLENVRINTAKQLLEAGIEPLDAALRTGFADQSHFTGFFKCFIGLTPKQYQNIFKEA